MKDFFSNNTAFLQCKKDFESSKLNHAYLFLSDDNITNLEFTKYVVKYILCDTHTVCDSCENCIKLNKETHPDVFVFPKEKNIVVENVEEIIEEASKSKMLSKYKVFVLNEIDNATQQAQNKLLKILEEPPKDVIFFLNATNKSKILQTILSRVKQINIFPISKEILRDEISKFCEPEMISICLNFGNGWLGKTTALAKNENFKTIYGDMLAIATKMKTSKEVIFYSSKLAEDKNNFLLKMEILSSFYRKILLYKETNENIPDELKAVSDEFSVKALSKILKHINFSKKKKDFNVNLNLIADNLLMKILEEKYLWK